MLFNFAAIAIKEKRKTHTKFVFRDGNCVWNFVEACLCGV